MREGEGIQITPNSFGFLGKASEKVIFKRPREFYDLLVMGEKYHGDDCISYAAMARQKAEVYGVNLAN